MLGATVARVVRDPRGPRMAFGSVVPMVLAVAAAGFATAA
jgi:hypothetical protein